jgi:hypothetical protein
MWERFTGELKRDVDLIKTKMVEPLLGGVVSAAPSSGYRSRRPPLYLLNLTETETGHSCTETSHTETGIGHSSAPELLPP